MVWLGFQMLLCIMASQSDDRELVDIEDPKM